MADKATQMAQEARECEVISALERDQARLDRMIAAEERRRREIQERLEEETRKLGMLQR